MAEHIARGEKVPFSMPPYILSESIQGKSCTNKYIGNLSKKRSNLEESYKLKKKSVLLLDREKKINDALKDHS